MKILSRSDFRPKDSISEFIVEGKNGPARSFKQSNQLVGKTVWIRKPRSIEFRDSGVQVLF